MTKSVELAQLAEMQSLKTQRCGGDAAAARRDRKVKAERTKIATTKKQACEAGLSAVFAAQTFCPDRMRIAAGHLAEAEREHASAKHDLSQAEQHEVSARNAWQEAGFQRDILNSQARQAKRAEARHSDDAEQAERMSLRAAIERGLRR